MGNAKKHTTEYTLELDTVVIDLVVTFTLRPTEPRSWTCVENVQIAVKRCIDNGLDRHVSNESSLDKALHELIAYMYDTSYEFAKDVRQTCWQSFE